MALGLLIAIVNFIIPFIFFKFSIAWLHMFGSGLVLGTIYWHWRFLK
jgi:hypothetical protein